MRWHFHAFFVMGGACFGLHLILVLMSPLGLYVKMVARGGLSDRWSLICLDFTEPDDSFR